MQAPMLQLFNPNIDEAFRTQRGSFFVIQGGWRASQFCRNYGKRQFTVVTLQSIYVLLRWERGDCIQIMVFLRGHVAQAARRLATGSTARVSERWRFSSRLRIRTAPGVHSAYYKISTVGKGGRAQDQPFYFFLVPWLCIHRYVDPCIHIPRGPSWPIMGISFTVVFLCENFSLLL